MEDDPHYLPCDTGRLQQHPGHVVPGVESLQPGRIIGERGGCELGADLLTLITGQRIRSRPQRPWWPDVAEAQLQCGVLRCGRHLRTERRRAA
ncbi:MAG: hypothetical protein PVJ47_06130 [Thiohalocapsa sp.]